MLAPSDASVDAARASDAAAREPPLPNDEDLRACDAECAARAFPAIAAAVDRSRSDPRGALRTLRGQNARVAHVWAALVALELGDEATMRAEMTLLERTGVDAMLSAREGASPRAQLLTLLRDELDRAREENSEGLAPCWIFERFARDALDAFTAMHASTLDGVARRNKQRCFDALVARSMPDAQRTAFVRAFDALAGAPFIVVPQPPEGTMWVGLSIGATDALYDAALAPDLAVTDGDEASLRASRAQAARRQPRLAARLRAFEQTQRQHLSTVAEGLCANARSLGRPMTSDACARAARVASDAALARWLRAISNR